MHVLDYDSLRQHLAESLADADLNLSLEEAVYLGSQVRACEILVGLSELDSDIWGKVTFEWSAANQALLEQLERDGVGSARLGRMETEAAQVQLHAEFHMHFPTISLATDVICRFADSIKEEAERFFGDEGGVVAEVVMTSDEARLECLRFEVSTSGPLVAAEPWWEPWGAVSHDMLVHMSRTHRRLLGASGA